MADRHDPMIAAAGTILAAEEVARELPGARATVGKVVPVPGGSNVIASAVEVWLDARHEDESSLRPLVHAITARARSWRARWAAARHSRASRTVRPRTSMPA